MPEILRLLRLFGHSAKISVIDIRWPSFSQKSIFWGLVFRKHTDFYVSNIGGQAFWGLPFLRWLKGKQIFTQTSEIGQSSELKRFWDDRNTQTGCKTPYSCYILIWNKKDQHSKIPQFLEDLKCEDNCENLENLESPHWNQILSKSNRALSTHRVYFVIIMV